MGTVSSRTPQAGHLASPGTLVTTDCLGEMGETEQRATKGTQVPAQLHLQLPSTPFPLPLASSIHSPPVRSAPTRSPLSIHVSIPLSHRPEDTDRGCPGQTQPGCGVQGSTGHPEPCPCGLSGWVGLRACPPASLVLQGRF